MNYKKVIISAICLVLFIGVLNGEFITKGNFYSGNTLLGLWHDNPITKPSGSVMDYQENALFMGYCAGIYDAWNGHEFDAPDSVTLSQIMDVALKYLRKHPGTRHMSAAYLLKLAYAEVFPLRQNIKN